MLLSSLSTIGRPTDRRSAACADLAQRLSTPGSMRFYNDPVDPKSKHVRCNGSYGSSVVERDQPTGDANHPPALTRSR